MNLRITGALLGASAIASTTLLQGDLSQGAESQRGGIHALKPEESPRSVNSQEGLSHYFPASINIRIQKGSTTKQLRGTLIFSNNTRKQLTLRKAEIVRISNTNAPSYVLLKPGEIKKVDFTGSVSSADGISAIGAVYIVDGTQVPAIQHVLIKNGLISGVNLRSQLHSETPDVTPSDRVPPLSGSIPGFGNVKGRPGSLEMKSSGGNSKPATKSSSSRKLVPLSTTLTQPARKKLADSINDRLARAVNSAIGFITAPLSQPAYANTTRVNGTVTFRSLKTLSGSEQYYPYAGITVRAIGPDSNCMTTRPLDQVVADGNGRYALSVRSGSQFRLCFLTSNAYIHLTEKDGQSVPYGFKTGLFTNSGGTVTRNYVDTIQPGVGDIWYTAMFYKTSLDSIGVDPVRTTPIRIVYPSQQCWTDNDKDPTTSRPGSRDGKESPWSCSYPSGLLVIKDDHAAETTTIHELAHQLDQKNGRSRGSGVGGNHGHWECTDPVNKKGMILTEGFANYEKARALSTSRSSDNHISSFRRDVTDPINGGTESIARCTERVTAFDRAGDHDWSSNASVSNAGANTMEKGVFAVMWDFYDRSTDGKDNLYYVSPGYLTAKYLSANWDGIKGFLAQVYRDCRTDANKAVTENGARCREIFTQNFTSDTNDTAAN